ncbi:shikimate dehydrogenase [Roseivirga sp. 4D4]|uniref:shikimate dehydrogenase family protein n=1 Tax=Roseivirga sp. 4D4 TaxID=1889784 RepID=UPI000852E55F|nr:shikimate dehydrogenase [Roseivirga sp. 4D4]OEK02452.1 shikimate dehydrogenase [Roseivirga sp. 4D4]
MRKFGLIGYPLSHSFSKKYFANKFEKEGIADAQYELFPIAAISELPKLLSDNSDLVGLNVTIPYKEQVIAYLDVMDPKAEAIGAVNTIKIEGGKLTGYNTDYFGFKDSLLKFIGANGLPEKALILGTGGASKAVKAVLEDLGIEYKFVSREPAEGQLSYESIVSSPNHILSSLLIVNTTPLGMSPNEASLADLPYEQLTHDHLLYDLVYNPMKTAFMQKGIEAKCWVKNGLEMLHGQAEKSWEIWNG